jgi:Fe2+ transport system protein FeoA
MRIDLDDLGFDRGAHILIARALAPLAAGDTIDVVGHDANLALHVTTWCRARGHVVERITAQHLRITRGSAVDAPLAGAERVMPVAPTGLSRHPPSVWGLAARGALVEPGAPIPGFDLDDRDEVWTDIAPKLYAQACAAQWDPDTAINWSATVDHDDDVEDAVVQVMTYLIENELTALVVPSRFVGRVHPYFREVVQLLAVQIADEARHVEVFTRRAALRRGELGVSGAGGRASLGTLLDEPDFSLAMFMLSVLGEGTFLHLLSFLERHAPDSVTREVAHLALQDEARHVAFGQAHLEHRVAVDPAVRGRLRNAIVRRHDALRDAAGLNDRVFDALVVLAAGAWEPEAIARGYDLVGTLQADMDDGRRRRLTRLGFSPDEAAELAALHTRNFM